MTRHSHRLVVAAIASGALALTAACGGGGGGFSEAAPSAAPVSSPTEKAPPAALSVLIGSSGEAETAAVKSAAAAWATKSGNTATVTPAQNFDQQIGQAFAANKPPDVFYLAASQFADFANRGALYAYGDASAGASDFYPNLKDAFTYKDQFYCAPKDFSTLALQYNTDLFKKAGVTAPPTTWEELTETATTLKAKLPAVTPLVVGPTHDRTDAFLVQAGGRLLDEEGKAVADSAENTAGLDYVKSLLSADLMKFAPQVGAGWGGEALGKGKAAMTMEGNWIAGAMKTDYKNVKYEVAPLPAGPKGPGTLAFTSCWAIPASTPNKQQAMDFVNAMTEPAQQLAFAKAFGVMPSRSSVKADYAAQFPRDKAFLEGADYGVGPVKAPKTTQVLADYDNQLLKLETSNPKTILTRLQKNLSGVTG